MKTVLKILYKNCIILLISMNSFALAQNSDWSRVLDLRGQWKFEIGDNLEWAGTEFDDSDWENIFVPSRWEDEGFPGYDGYAWYRKHFNLKEDLKDKVLYLHLGYIDDVDEVYFNGHFIGFSGTLPPDVHIAYDVERKYIVPPEVINYSGENVIAIRVYDMQMAGGIIRGNVGLFEPQNYLTPDIPITGHWKFKAGDNLEWMKTEYDDWNWKEVIVPAFWETQGFKDYDGFGWYRKEFIIPDKYKNQRLILLLGRIDDVDEAYLNGERIGQTGKIYQNVDRIPLDNNWLKLRAYYIPRSYLRFNQKNLIAVRVYDGMVHGGIYNGPIGIVKREKYLEWQKQHGREKSKLQEFFDSLFNK